MRSRTSSNDRLHTDEGAPKSKYKMLMSNKNIFYDEFTEMFRCKKVDEDLIAIASDLSLDIQEKALEQRRIFY